MVDSLAYILQSNEEFLRDVMFNLAVLQPIQMSRQKNTQTSEWIGIYLLSSFISTIVLSYKHHSLHWHFAFIYLIIDTQSSKTILTMAYVHITIAINMNVYERIYR